ncbi:MAG: 50S ribosomal protein L25 [Deltaproteobacteria bacterium]|nr:50S ribosomal protein L25 [Candidatus Zymogenaceae bacterium]
MELAELKVETRQGSGKGAARRMRRNNRLPGIIYGRGEESVKVQVDPAEIRAAVRSHEGSLPVFSIVGINEAEKLSGSAVIVRELQTDPLTHEYLHVDFMKIDLSKQITVEVPLHFTGKARGLKMGGVMDEPVRKLDVICFPTDIPEFIEVDTTDLDIGESIHLKDILLPKGCSVDTTVDITLVSVIVPRLIKETEELAEETVEEPEEEKAE